VAGLVCRAANHLPGARQLILDVLGADVEDTHFIRGGVQGGFGGGLDLLAGGPQPGIIPVVAVKPDGRTPEGETHD
jgi:hypothetical protein